MVNHFRTLLMNVNGSAPLLEYLAEEIVDPSYVALRLPPELQTLRAALFGSNPDRHMLNYRCRQLLCLVHSTALNEFVYELDNRLTYRLNFDSLLRTQWKPAVTRISGTGNLSILGESEAADTVGRIYNSYLLTVASENQLQIQQTVAPFSKVEMEFTVGEKFSLPGSALQGRLNSAAAPQLYRLDEYQRPQTDLGALADSASRLGEVVYNYVFGVAKEEPFSTFRNLWFRKQELPLRLGALTCALVYRMEALRTNTTR